MAPRPLVVLTRQSQSDQGTFGSLVVDGLVLWTGEQPWRDNRRNVSCIPAGRYGCAWTWSPRFRRDMYLVYSVPGRSGIRIHSANLMGDTALGYRSQLAGCIALGERLGILDGQQALLISAPAVRRLETYLGHRPFTLEVIDGFLG